MTTQLIPIINISVLNWYNNLFMQGFFFSTILFTIGLFGLFLNTQSFLITMMSLEIMLLGLIMNFILISKVFFDPLGQITAIFVITLAAAESAVGLGLIIAISQFYKSIEVSNLVKSKY